MKGNEEPISYSLELIMKSIKSSGIILIRIITFVQSTFSFPKYFTVTLVYITLVSWINYLAIQTSTNIFVTKVLLLGCYLIFLYTWMFLYKWLFLALVGSKFVFLRLPRRGYCCLLHLTYGIFLFSFIHPCLNLVHGHVLATAFSIFIDHYLDHV